MRVVVLDPTKKWKYFKEQGGVAQPDWLEPRKVKVERFWEYTYKGLLG